PDAYGPDEVRPALRAADAEATRRAERVPLLPRGPRADRPRRPGGLRHRVGGRAPLPDRVRPLLRARGLPLGRRAAHEAHPHRPIWMAATSPQSWEIAGQNGIGILGLTIFVSVPQLEDRIRVYRKALEQAKPVGKFVNDKVGAFTIVHVADTKAQAVANGATD